MPETLTKSQRRDAGRIYGELAVSNAYAAIQGRIEELRLEEGITQAQIAERIGVTEQQISRWLAEPRNMTVRSVGRLCAGLEAELHLDIVPMARIVLSTHNCSHTTTSGASVVPAADWKPTGLNTSHVVFTQATTISSTKR